MDAIKSMLPAGLTGESSRSELAEKLGRFTFERVLSQGTTSPYLYLLGKIDNEPAIVHLQRVAFNVPEAPGPHFSLVAQLDTVKSLEKNDIYEWAQGWYGQERAADVKVNIIHPCTATHIKKYSAQKRFMINETPEIYRDVVKPYINSFPPSRIQWVYNVLEHKKEADKIVYEDTDPETGFMILPDMKWDGKTLSALYLTAIVHTHRLKSIRDLRPSDLDLLRKIKKAGEQVVVDKYGLQPGGARLFLHYQPSYYHLHVHIVSLTNEGFMGAEVGKAHLLDDVISLLEQSSSTSEESLLQKMTLTYQIGQEDGLYKALLAAGVHGQIAPAAGRSNDTDDSASDASRAAWDEDADLPICTACGTQYPAARDDCPICEDDRQFVPANGQAWSSLRKLADYGHKNELVKDSQDDRISYIKTTPAFGIGQTPFLIETAEGSYIWDCCAFLSQSLISQLKGLKGLRKPLKAIVISHPHFYTTSLTWARVLSVPLVVCGKDKEWYQRLSDVKEGEIVWYDEDHGLTSNLKALRCGGHFEGSAVLYWDRSREPSPDQASAAKRRQDGIVFCADTAMVQPTQKGFTFQYSVPNMIPLNPYDVAYLYKKLKDVSFGQATSTWPGRFVREDAGSILAQSVRKHLETMGCDWLWVSLSNDNQNDNAGSTSWNSADILSPRASDGRSKQSLIILNQPITRRDIFEKLWNNCDYRICADGGANRLYDLLSGGDRERFLPDAIKGDLDSLRHDVREYYESRSTIVLHDESEYTTDLQKCIEEIDSRSSGTEAATIIILGGLSGRLDQTTHVLALLQKLRKGGKGRNARDEDASTSAWQGSDFKVFMGDELVSNSRGEDLYKDFGKGDGTKDIRVISENCVAWVLDVGEHIIEIDHERYGPTCGVLPLGIESSHVETKGLRWDFDWQTAFSTQISTSNHLDPNNKRVIVKTSRPVWWTMEIRDIASDADGQYNHPMHIPPHILSDRSFGFLTTMRCAVTEMQVGNIPLLEEHLDRLGSVWAGYKNATQGSSSFGIRLESQIQDFVKEQSPADYRLRAVLSTSGQLQLQAVPLPAPSPPFATHPDELGLARYDVLLNPESCTSGKPYEGLYRIKTTKREVYELPLQHTKEVASQAGIPIPFDTILHWQQPGSTAREDDLVSETSFANIAVHVPLGDGSPEWLTPEESDAVPFLPGVMRRHLIKQGVLRTGRITVADFERWVAEGRRVIGMNGLRGVWEANVLSLPK